MNARFRPCQKFSETISFKTCAYLTVLFLLAFYSLSGHSREAIQKESIAEKETADSAISLAGMPDEITFKSSLGNVVVPHDVHVKDVKLKCDVCHHQIRAKELDTPHPDYLVSTRISCRGCHLTDSATRKKYYKCSECHHSEPDNIADETLSSKVVIHQSCWKCHEAGTGAEASAGCSNCHAKEDQ